MKPLRLRQALLGSAVAIGLLGPAGATASATTVVTACTPGISTATVKTCLSVTGSREFIQSAMARATALDVDSMLDVELVGPSQVAPTVDLHTGFTFVRAGHTLVGPYWCPDRDVQPGSYSAITRRRDRDGTVTKVGEVIVIVPI